MKKTNRFAALLLTLVMILTVIPMNAISSIAVSASDFTEPTIFVDSKYSAAGSTVTVDVAIANNPGIAGATLTVAYDQLLTLTAAANGEAFSNLTFTKPGSFSNPSRFLWDSESGETKKDGTILTLTFEVSESASSDANLNIEISSNLGDFYDEDMDTVNLQLVNGNITVIDYLPGDVNADGVVNGKDVTMVRRHIVGGYDQTINVSAANVNGDNTINGKDVTAIRRYIVGGYGIELLPAPIICDHNMKATAYKAATCTEDGNVAYWYCMLCNKYFKDAEGTTEVSFENTVIPAKGHTVVVDPAVAPTDSEEGWTEGSHCSECGEVIVPPQPIPMLQKEEHSITYDISNGDIYLASLSIDNPNQNFYYSEDGLTLKNLSVPGYTFLGWYDLPAGENAENIKKISVGQNDDVELYAHWSKIEYTVQYKSDVFIDKQTDTYTVDKGLTLNTPRLSNYIFTGWADDDGNLYSNSTVPVGSVGNITLTANWTSERNKTYTKPKLDEPIIVEDEENNMILFTYEIGEIQNVPLYTVHDFGYIAGDGITKTETKTYSTTVTDEAMQSYASSAAKATTESSDWTLSSNWNTTTSLDEDDYTEKGFTKEEAETIAKSNTDTWNISSGTSGSISTTTLNQSQSGWTNDVKVNGSSTTGGSATGTHEHEYTETKNNSFNVNGKVTYTPKSYNFSLGADGASIGAGTSGGFGGEIGAGYTHDWGSTDKTKNSSSLTISGSKSNGFEAGGSTTGGGLNSTTASSNSSWNSSSSKGGSTTASQSETISTAVSEKIAKTYHYGESTCEGGANSESKGFQQTQSSSDEYGSSVKYSTAVSESQTNTWTTQATKAGYHRWIMVGKAHVFAIVGYDMSSKSFFVYTYSVMDDAAPQAFEDYSYISGDYNDNENGVIPFEVPYEVAEFVAERTSYSQGLKVDQTTGIITEYTGTDDYVVIPEYYNIGDGDVVKVTGVSSTAFKGNTDIKGVRLSDFITEIPANAFEGCTSLLGINGGDISSIGEEAFKGCTSLEICLVDNYVTSLGNNAFNGCDRLLVNAANSSVVEAAVNSGVKKIQLYINGAIIENGANALKGITLNVPDSVETFALNGYDNTYLGFKINSAADDTIIYKTHFNTTEGIPVQTSSSKLTLNQVEIVSNGWGLVMSADNTELSLQSTIEITTNTDKSVLCKNLALSELKDNVNGILKVSGKIYVAGDYTGSNYLFNNGEEVKQIDAWKFDSYLNPHRVIFDPNGGSVSESSRVLYFGQKYGVLPEPTREYYEFIGWYTEEDGGERVTADSTFNVTEDVTLYAHWSLQSFVITFDANGGSVATSSIRANCNSAIGTLPIPTRDYYTFDGWYTEESGGTNITSSSVYTTPTNVTLYAHWTCNSYTASWSTGTGYSITVNRTSSPYGGASTGTISSGSKVYYGDVLNITYTASTGYSISSKGATSITVSGNVSSSNIYATATANRYTYNVVYKSSNGTSLGSTTVTKVYGTTNTISAPSKTGYNTPSSQFVKWDSTSAKTITFTYSPSSVSNPQTYLSGTWHAASKLSYSSTLEYRNRTATSIEVRLKWTNTIGAGGYYGYWQKVHIAYKNNSDSDYNTGVEIAGTSTFANASSSSRSETVYTNWLTIPVTATQTTVTVYANYWSQNYKSGGANEYISKVINIPAY